MRELAVLDPTRFDRREYAALSWVKAFLTCPDGIPKETKQEYELALTAQERAGIEAAMKSMFFANLSVNTERYLLKHLVFGKPAGEPIVCELPQIE